MALLLTSSPHSHRRVTSWSLLTRRPARCSSTSSRLISLVDRVAGAAQRTQQAVREDLVVFGDQNAHRLSPGLFGGFPLVRALEAIFREERRPVMGRPGAILIFRGLLLLAHAASFRGRTI